MRTYEIGYILKTSTNSIMHRAIIQASDTTMARRIFEQQNPQCKIVSPPREIR